MTSQENQKIIDRIRKLIKLAQDAGATEGERENAMRMAHATLAKYNLDMADIDLAPSIEPRVEVSFHHYKEKGHRIIANSIAKLFFCKCYYYPKADADVSNAGKKCKYVFVGRASNTVTAQMMTEWIISSVLSEQKKGGYGSSFGLGAAARIALRVKEIVENKDENQEFSSSMALAVVSLYKTEQQANEDFITQQGLKMKDEKSRKSKVDFNQYCKGSEFGDKINLNHQVAGTKQAALTA